MKKFTLLLVVSILFISCSNNDGNLTFSGNILLRSQEEINAFGANQYQRVTGELAIRPEFSTDDIVDLSPLSSLRTVDGPVTISGCANLETVELNVEEVGILTIVNMDSRTINFPALRRTTSDFLTISNNPFLETMMFNSLTSTGSELRIRANGRIQNLDGFQSLTSLGSNFGSGLYISENPMLLNINALININADIGLLQMEDNDMLTSLDGLENLRFGNIEIILNNNLTDFCAIREAVINGNIDGDSFDGVANYSVGANAFNPTFEDMVNNNCSQ